MVVPIIKVITEVMVIKVVTEVMDLPKDLVVDLVHLAAKTDPIRFSSVKSVEDPIIQP